MPMLSASNREHFWAVVLAGGKGTRLQRLTRMISGGARPKQFCPIFGGKSLLAHTRERPGPLFGPDRTVLVVTRAHEEFYRHELGETDASRIVVQPVNRGTGAAIAASQPRRLLVLRGAGSGWAEFGDPARVITTPVRDGIESGWLGEMLNHARCSS